MEVESAVFSPFFDRVNFARTLTIVSGRQKSQGLHALLLDRKQYDIKDEVEGIF